MYRGTIRFYVKLIRYGKRGLARTTFLFLTFRKRFLTTGSISSALLLINCSPFSTVVVLLKASILLPQPVLFIHGTTT